MYQYEGLGVSMSLFDAIEGSTSVVGSGRGRDDFDGAPGRLLSSLEAYSVPEAAVAAASDTSAVGGAAGGSSTLVQVPVFSLDPVQFAFPGELRAVAVGGGNRLAAAVTGQSGESRLLRIDLAKGAGEEDAVDGQSVARLLSLYLRAVCLTP